MIFQNNILHAFQSWKLNNAQLNGNTITIKPNGTIQCIIYPKNGDEAKINEAYKVIVNQGENKGKLSFTFTNHLSNNDIKKSSIVIYSGDDIDKIVKTDTNTTRQTVVTIKNLSEQSIDIVNVELKPSSNVSSDLEAELTKYVTHIVKYSNNSEVIVEQEKKLIANLNVELQEKSNLLLHVFINGVSSSNSTLTLNITVNGKELEYTPILSDINSGNFIIGIPGNIMDMSEGENRVKIYATVSEGSITMNVNKIQVTLDGQNMVYIYGEDIWFGPSEDNDFDPCEHEIFTYDEDILFIEGGKLQVKCIEEQVNDMTLKTSLSEGNVYEFEFNIDKIRKYENVEVIE